MTETLRTLQPGLRLLELLTEFGRPMRAKELSELTGTNLSTTYQLIRTLRVEEYIVRHPGAVYQLGPSVGRLVGQFQSMPLPSPVALQALNDLHRAVAERCYLAGWWLSRIVMICSSTTSADTPPARLGPGYSGAPHARASCKAILAHLPPADVRRYIQDSDISVRTPATLRTLPAIEAELRLTRLRGYATDNEEFERGISCIAAPIFDAAGSPIYSLTIGAATATYHVRKEEFRSHILAVTSHASRRCGYPGSVAKT